VCVWVCDWVGGGAGSALSERAGGKHEGWCWEASRQEARGQGRLLRLARACILARVWQVTAGVTAGFETV
jgi:hypothetical protein